jgi:hypothetical protein
VESLKILEKAGFVQLPEGTQYYVLFVTRLLDAVEHHQRQGGRPRSYRGTRPLYAIKSTTSSVKAQRASIRRTSTKLQEGSEAISTSLPTSTVGYSTTWTCGVGGLEWPNHRVAKTDMSNCPIMKAMSVMGVDLTKIKVPWAHRTPSATWFLLSRSGKGGETYGWRDSGIQNEIVKFIFSEELFSDVVTRNDLKGQAELDDWKTGVNQRLWSAISESYNDAANNGEYSSLAFVEDIHVKYFVTTFDLQVYKQLTWVKAGKWFKEIVNDYDRFMVKYTTSGQVQTDFHGYVEGNNHVYYYPLFIEEKPETQKSLTSVLNDELFSESTKKLGAGSNRRKEGQQFDQETQSDTGCAISGGDRLLHSRSHQMKKRRWNVSRQRDWPDSHESFEISTGCFRRPWSSALQHATWEQYMSD